jgi:microcystin-dependent protein
MAWQRIIVPAALGAVLASATPAQAGFEPYIGDIVPYAFNFCPVGWVPADGRLLSIAQNTPLFALIGTIYGGDGVSTFAVPDLRGRVAVGDGSATFGTFVLGQRFGSEQFSVTIDSMPAHTHTATQRAVPDEGNSTNPTGNSLARDDSVTNRLYSTSQAQNNMNGGDVIVGSAGSGAPVTLTDPALAMNYCIANEGVFPPRS